MYFLLLRMPLSALAEPIRRARAVCHYPGFKDMSLWDANEFVCPAIEVGGLAALQQAAALYQLGLTPHGHSRESSLVPVGPTRYAS